MDVMSDVHIVILAAGKGTRMKSALPKVLHAVAGRPLIEHVIDTASQLSPASITLVIGHHADTVRGALAARNHVSFVVQEPQLGTAHALLTTEPVLRQAQGTLVMLSGDVPALSAESLKSLVRVHEESRAAATVMTAVVPNPHGYGRIVRSGGKIAAIVEEKDATADQRTITEINSGIYAFDLAGLFDAVRSIGSSNAQREYYLPDLVSIYRGQQRPVETVTVADTEEILGVNSRMELAIVGRYLRQRKNNELMASGVTIEDPDTTYVDADVRVGPDTILKPGVTLASGSVVGAHCVIHSGVRIAGSTIGDRAVVYDHCVVTDSVIGTDSAVGPFAHLRGHAELGTRAKVGNFVELKKTKLGDGSKAMHLTYLGDAVIGTGVNIGAGTITCNYDGRRKQVTTIEDGAFIGSDSQLIAPVTIGEGAYVGSGTTVRQHVPAGSLAVSAGKQRNIDGWAERKRNDNAD